MNNRTTRRQFIRSAATVAGGALIVNDNLMVRILSESRVRREISSLKSTELDKLRFVIKELQDKNGPDGYQKIAGYHGEPDKYCHDDADIFLPWHRAYVLHFEEAMRKIDPSITLPFWDWTSSMTVQSGIPKAFSDENYQGGEGPAPNPLHSAKIELLNRNTRRNPRDPVTLKGIAAQVTYSFSKQDYSGFNSAIQTPHGSLHTWVRGDMGGVAYSAYDPIFWAHHANVDRQWAQWQLGPNNVDPIETIMSKELKPFAMKVKDVIDHKNKLGYDYEGIIPMPSQTIFLAEKGSLFKIDKFEFDPNRQDVFLYVHDLKPAAQSFNVDVFINQPEANEKTALQGNPHYAGSFGIFGGAKHTEHLKVESIQRVLNVTRTVATYAKANQKTDLQIKLVITDMDGKLVDISKLPLRGFSIQSE